MIRAHESEMLTRLRRWRKKSCQADKAKPLSKLAKEDEKLAREFGLPLVQAHKSNPGR